MSDWTWFDVKGQALTDNVWVSMSLCLPLGEKLVEAITAPSESESKARLQDISDQLTVTTRVLAESYAGGYGLIGWKT
jgi:hypothetical protein